MLVHWMQKGQLRYIYNSLPGLSMLKREVDGAVVLAQLVE